MVLSYCSGNGRGCRWRVSLPDRCGSRGRRHNHSVGRCGGIRRERRTRTRVDLGDDQRGRIVPDRFPSFVRHPTGRATIAQDPAHRPILSFPLLNSIRGISVSEVARSVRIGLKNSAVAIPVFTVIPRTSVKRVLRPVLATDMSRRERRGRAQYGTRNHLLEPS